jgi:uncharacterized protein
LQRARMSRIHPPMSSTPVCLITGASSGIGAALAREFARHGHALVLTARRQPELDRLADEIAHNGAQRPHVIAADIASGDGAAALERALDERGLEVSMMVDLNVRALTDLTLRFIAPITRHKGGILNVASIAGFMPGPGMGVYHATKAYAVSFSEALHGELGAEGVNVTALCPGPVPTPFLARAGIPHGYFPRFLARSAERVAREGYAGLMAGRRIVVPGSPNLIMTLLPRFLPRGLIADGTARRWRRNA